MASICLLLMSLVLLIPAVSCLECYQCTEREHNRGVCSSVTESCDQFQDACTTYIRWGSPPTITSRGRRIYYISKACDTKQGCERRQAAQRTTCRRSWFNDWACTYCCYEDLCNYFVTLNGDEESFAVRATWSSGVITLTAILTHLVL
ncbi:hypothetical protein NP493_13g14057 [Ridgeia piscesae]|uniref:Uncharacterized protein n=1 Tax=Ridgeia piscesae TaxID=27915 RepID=A0AAD9PF64_RIDPI|nr:hypothetical protein NP493_13g14057 [Ridgeia piscesae]